MSCNHTWVQTGTTQHTGEASGKTKTVATVKCSKCGTTNTRPL